MQSIPLGFPKSTAPLTATPKQTSEQERDRRRSDRATAAISRRYGDALRAADGAGAERLALECLHKGSRSRPSTRR